MDVLALAMAQADAKRRYSTQRPATPPGMSWLPFTVTGFEQQNGRVAVSKTAEQTFNAVATLTNATNLVCYTDPVLGNDANDGSKGAPKASTATAVTSGNFNVHILSPGNHGPLDIRRDVSSGNRTRRFYGSGNPREPGADLSDASKYTIFRVIGDLLPDATWVASSGTLTYKTTLTGTTVPIRVLCSRRRDEFNRPVPLAKLASAAAVATAGSGWYFDSVARELHVRVGSIADAATFQSTIAPMLEAVYTNAGQSNFVRMYGGEAYFENCVFYGVYPWTLYGNGGVPVGVFKNCVFLYSDGTAFSNQGGRSYCFDCEVYRPFGDGWGGHIDSLSAGFYADNVLVNCEGSYIGDLDTYGTSGDNCNVASTHENGRAAYLGLRGQKTAGPVVIDVGTGAGSTGVSWWLGVHAQDSYASANGSKQNFYAYGVRTVWMDRCSSRGDAATNDVTSQDAGTIIRYGQNAVRGYATQAGGVVSSYDPYNPV